MKYILCNKCHNRLKEIEFEYEYFKKKYKHTCKECDGYQRPLDITNSKLNKFQERGTIAR